MQQSELFVLSVNSPLFVVLLDLNHILSKRPSCDLVFFYQCLDNRRFYIRQLLAFRVVVFVSRAKLRVTNELLSFVIRIAVLSLKSLCVFKQLVVRFVALYGTLGILQLRFVFCRPKHTPDQKVRGIGLLRILTLIVCKQ